MRVPHDALVLVTDGRKLLLLRNAGDAEFPNLRTILSKVDENPADRAQKSDSPGRAFSSSLGGAGRSAYDETDLHERRETAFAIAAAALLHDRLQAGPRQPLIVVAPPKTLGELRAHYCDAVRKNLVGEIAKDLVKHPLPEIEQIVGRSQARHTG